MTEDEPWRLLKRREAQHLMDEPLWRLIDSEGTTRSTTTGYASERLVFRLEASDPNFLAVAVKSDSEHWMFSPVHLSPRLGDTFDFTRNLSP